MKKAVETVKGRIEEAAGVLLGNGKLRAKGQWDQIGGDIEKDLEKDVREVKASARKIVSKAKRVVQKAVAKAKSRDSVTL